VAPAMIRTLTSGLNLSSRNDGASRIGSGVQGSETTVDFGLSTTTLLSSASVSGTSNTQPYHPWPSFRTTCADRPPRPVSPRPMRDGILRFSEPEIMNPVSDRSETTTSYGRLLSSRKVPSRPTECRGAVRWSYNLATVAVTSVSSEKSKLLADYACQRLNQIS